MTVQSVRSASQPEEDYQEPITSILSVPLKVKHTPARLAHDILVHNELAKFSQIGIVGLPGSGKSTFLQCVLHAIHSKDPSYAIHHFKKADVLNLDKILEELPKRQNAIIVFDDISYLFEQLSDKKIADILHALTIVREKLDPVYKATRVICIMLFHYSYALLKGLRMTNFRIMCSISDEEFTNYQKILGYHNGKNIRDFVRKYLSMMRYKKWKLASPNDEPFQYYTDKPFRLALVSNLGELHYCLYHKVNCSLCAQPRSGKNTYDKPDVPFWDQLLDTYDFAPVWNVLRLYTWSLTRKKIVDIQFRKIWNHIEGQDKQSRLNLLEIVSIFKEAKKIKGNDRIHTSMLRHEHIFKCLKEMDEKFTTEGEQVTNDTITNVKPETLDAGSEETINLEDEEPISGLDEEDDEEEGQDEDNKQLYGAEP